MIMNLWIFHYIWIELLYIVASSIRYEISGLVVSLPLNTLFWFSSDSKRVQCLFIPVFVCICLLARDGCVNMTTVFFDPNVTKKQPIRIKACSGKTKLVASKKPLFYRIKGQFLPVPLIIWQPQHPSQKIRDLWKTNIDRGFFETWYLLVPVV